MADTPPESSRTEEGNWLDLTNWWRCPFVSIDGCMWCIDEDKPGSQEEIAEHIDSHYAKECDSPEEREESLRLCKLERQRKAAGQG